MNLQNLHDQINAIGGHPQNEFDRGINHAVSEALKIIDAAMLLNKAAPLAYRVSQIADDFIPDSDKDAPLALQEMRDALHVALAENFSVLGN